MNSSQKSIKHKISYGECISAPEVIDRNKNNYYFDKYNVDYSYEIDIWSLGYIMHFLLVGKAPNVDYDTNMKQFSQSIPNISKRAKDCIRRLLEPYPKQRQKLNQILMLDFFYY